MTLDRDRPATDPPAARADTVLTALWSGLALLALVLQALVISVPLDAAAKGLAATLPGVAPFGIDETLANLRVLWLPVLMVAGLNAMAFVAHPAAPRLQREGLRVRAFAARERASWATFARALVARPRARWLILGVLGGVLTWVVVIALLPLLPTPEADLRTEALAGADPFVRSLWAAVISPLPEEVLYRGPLVVLAALVRTHATRPATRTAILISGAVVSTVIFGFAHLGWSVANFVATLILGAVCSALTLGSRSLWPAVVAHAVYNAI